MCVSKVDVMCVRFFYGIIFRLTFIHPLKIQCLNFCVQWALGCLLVVLIGAHWTLTGHLVLTGHLLGAQRVPTGSDKHCLEYTSMNFPHASVI